MRFLNLLSLTLLVALIGAGCADMKVPTMQDIIQEPLGSSPVKLGMTKDQVVSIYGEPSSKETVSSKEWSGTREEWFYNAKYTAMPVGAGYLSENLYLYFDGENLTNISRQPLGQQNSSDTEEFIK